MPPVGIQITVAFEMFVLFALQEKDVICLGYLVSVINLQINNYCVFVSGEYEALQLK